MSLPLSLIDALADGDWHSGERLAEAEGITRAAVAKRAERLRELGLEMESRQGLGYRLLRPLERLDEAALQASAPGGLKLRVEQVTDSTNRQLTEASAAEDPQALFAEYQTAGRGRRGRAWQSPYGANLYFSLAWSFAAWPPQLSALPLAVGVACARALSQVGLADAGLKWPNDLYVDGRKLGGILIEHRGEAGGACRVVVGVGLNVAMSGSQAEAIDQPWVSLNDALASRGLPPASRNALAQALVTELHAVLSRYANEGFAPFAADWSRYDLALGREVNVIGGPLQSGIARGVDSVGALLVEDASGKQHALHSGDVSLRLTA